MKKLLAIVPLWLAMLVGIAQAQTRNVTITVEGNRIKQIAVDNRLFSITNTSVTGEQEVALTDLTNGQHQLSIYRSVSSNPTTTSFTLREGYDMSITVSSNGSVSLSETRTRRNDWGRNNDVPMTTAQYNKLYSATKAKTSSAARTTYLETEFSTARRGLTSSQASKLIALVNSESSRFKLAKQVYVKITDKNNFSLVSNLLNSTANRNALNNYIATVPLEDEDVDSNAAYTAMTAERFNVIYNEVVAENNVTDRSYYLVNFFNKDFNYYTSAQVRQLLQLISTEPERMSLAKAAYRGITDRENYYNEIANVLYSSVNRTELRTYINNYDPNTGNNNTNTTVAMSATAFNSLYQNIYYQSNTTTRYNSITTAFSTSGNYFTAAQAKQLIQLMPDENSRLILAKAAYRTLVDRTNYTVFNDMFNYQASRNDLYTYVINFNSGAVTTPVGVAMTDSEFNTLYRNISNAWSSSSKYSLATSAMQNTSNYFTATQERQLLLLISSEAERLALAKLGYDNLVDKYNYTLINDVFSTTESRNEFARFVTDVQNGGTGTVNRVAMSESEFKSIYRSIQYTFGLGAKMSSLTEIFNKETNYFTVAQIKQLIPLVSSETNRLELAKLAYNNATDYENYTQLLDIFSSQSSRDELSAYISTNSYNR